MILPVIMSGGSRFWPLSRALHPKQFLALLNDKTMLQETINRLDNSSCLEPLIICNEVHRFIVAEQLRANGSGSSDIILEPMGKNTSPAITLADMAKGDEPLLLVLATENVIKVVKAIVNKLIANNRYEYKYQLEVYRPWGKYDSLDCGEHDQVNVLQ